MNRAYVESLLVGVPLPATKGALIAYAQAQDGGARVAERLGALPERAYRSLDEVGEELEPVQPVARQERRLPRPESGDVPGGPAYVGEPVPPPAAAGA